LISDLRFLIWKQPLARQGCSTFSQYGDQIGAREDYGRRPRPGAGLPAALAAQAGLTMSAIPGLARAWTLQEARARAAGG
jgi:hypothetical protein